MTKQEIENRIAELEAEIENFELDPDDYENEYREALDSGGDVMVCGMPFQPSRILEELDPTAFRCGLVDYIDGCDKADNPDYQALEEELEELQSELEDIKAEEEDEEEEEED